MVDPHTSAALIKAVTEGSPADDAGFTPGCALLTVDGNIIRDILDWRWYTDSTEITLGYRDTEGDIGEVVLAREPGEDWGFDFSEALFDQVKQCRNACTFCFMRQLPQESRRTLRVRDDDFRLSFLQGTFITLTNLGAEDEKRIIEQNISPLHVSLHAITEDLRKTLIGKHADHGIEVCERLLAAGTKMQMQIVLLPGVNDGEELEKTLNWAFEKPGVVNLGIVPLGYTCHQDMFDKSFNDAEDARRVIEQVEPFQQKAMEQRGVPWVYLADEFYRNAYPNDLLDVLPPAKHYGSYEMFEDGIGIIRSFVDDWESSSDQQMQLAKSIDETGKKAHIVIGMAQREFLEPLIEKSPLKDKLIPLAVRNDYFGGNVDVTGLLCGCDIIRTIQETPNLSLVAIPSVIFNEDGITLDDMTLENIQKAVSIPITKVSNNASEYLVELKRNL